MTCAAFAALLVAAPGARSDDSKTPGSAPAAAPLEFSIKASPYRPLAGSAATVTATIRSADSEKKRILGGMFFVREDLGQLLFHEAARKDDRTFASAVTLPSGGEWRVFGSVVTEVDAESGQTAETIVGPVKLNIDGVRPLREPLIPQLTPSVRVNSYTLSLKPSTRIVAGSEQTLVFTLLDGQAQQVTDMDIWRDALAHLVVVDRDLKTLLHFTPDPTDPRTGRTGSLVFRARIPKEGIWRSWVLFRRGGQVFTMPLVLRVLNG